MSREEAISTKNQGQLILFSEVAFSCAKNRLHKELTEGAGKAICCLGANCEGGMGGNYIQLEGFLWPKVKSGGGLGLTFPLLVLTTALFKEAGGHGRLRHPAGRSTMWR